MTNDTRVLGRAALSQHILIQPRPRQRPSYNVDAENVSEGRTRKCLGTRDARSELMESCAASEGETFLFVYFGLSSVSGVNFTVLLLRALNVALVD